MKKLEIKFPFGKILFESLFYMALACLILELLSRTTFAKKILPIQSYGSSHPHFESQVLRIKAREEKEGHIDCVFIGNSQVLYGIDPAIVEQTYLTKTKQHIRCQNFGLGGMPPMTAESIAKILIKNFRPSIIIFGTGLWDYSSSNADTSIMSSPWVKFQLGIFSIDGWLYEHSHAYRFIFGIDRYLNNVDGNNPYIDNNGHATFSGHTQMTLEQQKDYFDTITTRPEITPLQRDGFRKVLSLNSSETKIIIVETPSNPVFYSVKRKARNLYPEFENMLVFQTELADTNLWLTQQSIIIPPEYWYDLLHLNKNGSVYFSQLLGEYMASIAPPILEVNHP